jgi:hypothetical protein
LDELRAAGCATILEEHASGADRSRPVLVRLLHEIRAVKPRRWCASIVWRARSANCWPSSSSWTPRGAFRSLRDPIDTATPQGMFSLQVLGALAQLERALIAERTKAGLGSARSRGRVGGNPGLRAQDPDAIRNCVRAAMPHIWKPSWRGSIPGRRPCGRCARISPGAMSCRRAAPNQPLSQQPT